MNEEVVAVVGIVISIVAIILSIAMLARTRQ
jgi:hypothetical protein